MEMAKARENMVIPMIHLTIDGTSIPVQEGTTVLEAARSLGAYVPTLCWHPNLSPANACRACAVEIEGSRALVSSCSRQAEEGLVVRTKTERVHNARKIIAELLTSTNNTALADGLVELVSHTSANTLRFAGGDTWQQPMRDDNSLFVRNYDACILCYRCVEACGVDVQNTFAIAMAGRGFDAHVDTGFDRSMPESDCVFCGNCVAVCPTGALMDKKEYELRQQGCWDEEDMTTTRTTCSYCGVGCELELHVMDNHVVKVTSPDDNPITHGMLCVKGRYGYEYVQAEDKTNRTVS